MRNLDLILLHCSASNVKSHDDISVIDKMHKDRGFDKIGYHYFIKTNGEIQFGRKDNEIGAHAKGWNSRSIGICLHGLNKEDFTTEQFISASGIITNILASYPNYQFDICGHRVVKNKLCPVFDMFEIYSRIDYKKLKDSLSC